MAHYVTKTGDTLDWLCWRFYDRQAEAVEALLEANPNLADLGMTLPAGLVIALPDLQPMAADQPVRLWD